MAVMTEEVTLAVFRGDATGGQEVTYRVPVTPGMVVLDAIHWIQAHAANDLAVRWNCKAGKCGSCSAEVNGRPRLMCKSRVDAFAQGGVIHVRPMKAFPIIKDLVTDVSWNYQVAKTIPSFAPADQNVPWTIHSEDMERVQEFRKCIECFLCQDVCHVLRDHEGKAAYNGPRYMVKIAALEMHPKDTLRRTSYLKGAGGVGYCNITKCCEEVCPEHIHITDNAIIPLKERVADDYFDPVRFVLRVISGKKS
jgi:succinate dehydrogenase / fumarate reductase iron-sulfur subunit